MIAKIKKKMKEQKEKQYWKKRAEKWKDFKNNNEIEEIKCGLVKETKYYNPRSWEFDCIYEMCYNKDFFNKYGCMYIRNFLDYKEESNE